MGNRGKISRKGLFHGPIVFLIFLWAILFYNGVIAESSDIPAPEAMAGSLTVPPIELVYKLLRGSHLYEGCLGPCECPALNMGKITGTFDIAPLAPTPLFDRYSLTNIRWTVIDHTGRIIHKIRGNGIYEIGGEVALTQQMTLFLSIDGQSPTTFESGLVAAQSHFPDISILISQSQNACLSYWMTIKAGPKW